MTGAGPLAALALVITNRAEPIATLRRLVADDPDLAALRPVIVDLEGGKTLPEALVRAGLVRRSEADVLPPGPPEELGRALGRLAEQRAESTPSILVIRWFPVLALAATTVPSLLIGLLVAVGGGGLYRGLTPVFAPVESTHLSGWWWLLQVGGFFLASGMLVLLGMVLPRIRGVWRFLPLDRPTARASALVHLLEDLRADRAATPSWKRWCWFSGAGSDAQQQLKDAAGDHATALIRLGVVPVNPRGEPEWTLALREATRRQCDAVEQVRPVATAFLIMAGVLGIMAWQSKSSPFVTEWWEYRPYSLLRWLTLDTFEGPAIITGLTVLVLWGVGWLRIALATVMQGPISDWPLVAQRLADAIERREDLTRALSRVQAWTGWAMARRLRAGRALDEPHPGRRLAAAGIAPTTMASILSTTPVEALPAVLRASLARDTEHLALGLRGQIILSLTTLGLLCFLVWYTLGALMRVIVHTYPHPPLALVWLPTGLMVLVVAIGLAFVGMGLARRWGWNLWWTGHRRLANGLRLRQALALRLPEADLGPGRDLPDILHRAGWACRTPADLDRALAADHYRRQLATHRRVVILGILLPVLVGIPLGLLGASVITMSQDMVRLTQSGAKPPLGGGSLVLWTLQRHLDLAEQRARLVAPPESP